MMTFSDEVVKSLFALGGAICGAAIGAVIKGYYDARGRERRELTVWKTTPTKLIMMASHLAPRVEIQFDGKKVATLASTEVQAVNTGNRAISNITLSIEIDGDAELISAEPSAVSPNLRDVEIKPSAKCITITAPFMNPGEEILLRWVARTTCCPGRGATRGGHVELRPKARSGSSGSGDAGQTL
jgi:hypothetical protein